MVDYVLFLRRSQARFNVAFLPPMGSGPLARRTGFTGNLKQGK